MKHFQEGNIIGLNYIISGYVDPGALLGYIRSPMNDWAKACAF